MQNDILIHGSRGYTPETVDFCYVMWDRLRKKHDDFIKEIALINSSYTIIDTYINNATKLRVIDKNGIVYLMHPKHMRAGSSPSIQTALDKRLAFETLSRLKHGDKYDYSLVEYKKAHDYVTIICPIHGSFIQSANTHLRGCGCSRCNRFKPFTLTNFIKRSRGRMATLYLISAYNEEEKFIKIGVTFKTIKDRFYGSTVFPYKYEIIDHIKSDPTTIYKLERKFHKILRSYKYLPGLFFGGNTECFQYISLNIARQIFNLHKV